MFDPEGSDTKREWIEIYNAGSDDVDMTGWKFFESGTNHSLVFSPSESILKSGEYVIIVDDINSFKLDYKNYDGVIIDSSFSLSNTGEELSIRDKSGNVKDLISYIAPADSQSGYSLELDDDKWRMSYQEFGTPGEKNSKKPEEKIPDLPKEYTKGISITELFPNPSQSQYEEYIELYNGSNEKIDLRDWTLHDASKSGKYVFSESLIIEAKKYLAIFKSKFKFALNNSGNESVILLDPNGAEVARVEYNGSKKDASYNFNGAKWRWSKFLTPDAPNILNNEPVGTLKIDDEIYVNVYANFFVSTSDGDGDKVKVTWDFGDGHKSYLAKTKHKFKKTGKYAASVKFSDGSEDVVKDFEIKVEEFPHPEIKIIAINANPKGADTGVESIIVQNKEKKKINLNGWSIATGWKEKFVNHPIKEDVIIKGKKEKEITHDVSSFTLNNTKAKIQLRYPDGEVAHEVKYKSPNKTVADGEIYRKEKGKKWEWISGKSNQSSVTSNQENAADIQNLTSNDQVAEFEAPNLEPETQSVESEIQKLEDVEIKLPKAEVENKIISASNNGVKIELLKSEPHVLGASTVREVDGQYFFTPDAQPQKHYAILFFKNIFFGLNSKLNSLLNYFAK